MSANQSFLSAARYGYDVALGVTEASANAVLKKYLDTLPIAELTICIVRESGRGVIIDYETLKQRANGSDPFNIPANADPETDPDIINLRSAYFVCAFKARIGLPHEMTPSAMPDIVTFNDSSKTVTFTLLCAEFKIAAIKFSGYDPTEWTLLTQAAPKLWLFKTMVGLDFTDVMPGDYGQLTGPIRDEIAKRGKDVFSIARLSFDFNNARVRSVPEINGLDDDSAAAEYLHRYFIAGYIKKLKENSEPVLGYALLLKERSQDTPLSISTAKLAISPYVDAGGQAILRPDASQQRLATLNYQCAVNDKIMPPTGPFGWNWVDVPGDAGKHGAIAINRNTLVSYLYKTLETKFAQSCFIAWVNTRMDGPTKVIYSWRLMPYGQANPVITEKGPDVFSLSFDCNASDSSGSLIEMGSLTFKIKFDAQIRFTGNTIVVVQHLVIYVKAKYMANSGGGNLVDKKITDTYTMRMEQDRLKFDQTTTSEDRSYIDNINPVADAFIHINDIFKEIALYGRDMMSTYIRAVPLGAMQQFLFPGGNTYTLRDVRFSDNQDLIAYITYLDAEAIKYLNS